MLIDGVDPRNLAEAGWGVIFPQDVSPAVRHALDELLKHRQQQAAQRYRELTYRPGESNFEFLARHGAAVAGPVDPKRMPYYLLIIGDPATIPFRFQIQLDVQHAIGRLFFETAAEYARYARGVIDAEIGRVRVPREISLFGAEFSNDPIAKVLVHEFVKPLAQSIRQQSGWNVRELIALEGTKEQLSRLLGGDETPALVVATGYSARFPPGETPYRPHQEAITYHDRPGWNVPSWILVQDHHFGADDVPVSARLSGLIAVLFTAQIEDRSKEKSKPGPPSIVGNLTQRLLGHPDGGALAVLSGSFSFEDCLADPRPAVEMLLQAFGPTLNRLIDGMPVGYAVEFLNHKYAEVSIELNELFNIQTTEDAGETSANDRESLAKEIATLKAVLSASQCIVLGDPAVQLPPAEPISRYTSARRVVEETESDGTYFLSLEVGASGHRQKSQIVTPTTPLSLG